MSTCFLSHTLVIRLGHTTSVTIKDVALFDRVCVFFDVFFLLLHASVRIKKGAVLKQDI